MKPHTFRKVIELSEGEWLPIYRAAKAAGLDPREYIKRAALKEAAPQAERGTARHCSCCRG